MISIRQKGQTAVVLPLLIVLSLAALYFFNYTQSMSSGLRYVTLKSYMHEHANIVFEKISKQLAVGQSPCVDLDPLYTLSSLTSSSVKTTSLSVLKSCFIADKSADIYDQFSLELSRIPALDDATVGATTIRASLTLLTRSMPNVPSLRLSQEKIFYIQISSLARFALFFRQQNAEMISMPEGASLKVYGDVMRAGTDPLMLSAMTLPSYVGGTLDLQFLGRFVLQGPLQVSGDGLAEKMLSIFKGGIFPKVMADFTTLPSMDTSNVWNQNIDYHYVYGGTLGYPLPADIASAHGPGDQVVNTTLAAVTSFPNSQIIANLSDTCSQPSDPTRGDVRPMIIYHKDSDVTLDLTTGGLFCGMVIANTLKIKVSDGQVAGLIGHFNVAKLVLEGKGRLYVINPFSTRDLPVNLTLPMGMTLPDITRQLLALKASVAKNFFLPFFRSPSGIPSSMTPALLSTFFESCSPNYCWKTDIPILDYTPLYAQTGWYKNVRFFVDKTL